jgi:hypothetical protein
VARESGATAKAVLEAIGALDATLAKIQGDDFVAIRSRLAAAAKAAGESVDWIVATYGTDAKAAHAGAVPFLKLMGIVCGGWQMARAAVAAQAQLARREGDAAFLNAKIGTARLFADHFLSQARGLRDAIVEGAPGVVALAYEQF